MARPNRREVDYFPHFVKNTKELDFLVKKYGNDGYATYYILLEKLGSTVNHHLILSDPIDIMLLSNQISIDQDLFLSIVNDMVSLRIFDRLFWVEYNVLFCQYFIDCIKDAYAKRKTDCITSSELQTEFLSNPNYNRNNIELIDHLTRVNLGDNTQSREKDRKGDEIKEDQKKVDEELEEIPIDDLLKKYYKNKIWKINVISNTRYRLKHEGELLSRMQEFEDHLRSHNIYSKRDDDFIKHFNNWLYKVRMSPISKYKPKKN